MFVEFERACTNEYLLILIEYLPSVKHCVKNLKITLRVMIINILKARN